MKNQALFSSKDKSKKLKCHLLHFLLGALRVTVKILKFGTPQTIAIIVLKIEKFDVTMH